MKRASTGIRSIIERALARSVKNGTLSKRAMDNAIRKMDMTDKKPVKKAAGGSMKKKFPDLSGDGKITKKDILMGRGVIKRGAKNGKRK